MGKIKLPPGLQLKSGKYIVDKVVDGFRIKKRLSVTTQAEAIEEYSKLVADATRGEITPAKASSLTVVDVLEHFWEKKLQHKAYGKNAKFLLSSLNRIIGNKKIISLIRSDIDDYIRIRGLEKNKSGKYISSRTIQAELQHLNMAITRAVDDELLPRNPIQRFCRVNVPRKPIIVLDDGYDQGPEWLALIDHIPEHWKLHAIIQYEAGLRPSEADRFRKEWFVPVGDHYMILLPGETEKTRNHFRRIPVSNRLAELLIPVCLGQTGELFTSTDYNKMIRKAVKDAKINPDIKMKCLRKTRLSIWDAIDPGAARVAGGHVPVDVHEESYARVNDARLFRLVGIELNNKLKLFKQA